MRATRNKIVTKLIGREKIYRGRELEVRSALFSNNNGLKVQKMDFFV